MVTVHIVNLWVGDVCIGAITPEAKINKPKGRVNENCIYRRKYSKTEKLKFYLFEVADTNKLISFWSAGRLNNEQILFFYI